MNNISIVDPQEVLKELDRDLSYVLSDISASTPKGLSVEQKAFACDFTKPVISFSGAGTGKTYTVVAALQTLQTYHGLSGDNINAMSFTNAATAELANRYERSCKKAGLSPTVKFNTFHSICKQVLDMKYKMKITMGLNYQKDVPKIASMLADRGVIFTNEQDSYKYARRVLDAIIRINGQFVYSADKLRNNFTFKSLDLDVDVFQEIRKKWFIQGILSMSITRGDIPLYALYILLTNPDITAKFKDRFKVMVVDEFQDMSVMYLKILSLISNNLVVVGDMRQQIYAFNGASPRIVEEYMKMYPDAKMVALSQSFRCADEIADWGNEIIAPNNTTTNLKGRGPGGVCNMIEINDESYKFMMDKIKYNIEHDSMEKRHRSLILFRNNFSVVPIVERLYKEGVKFRQNRFTKVWDIDIFDSLTELIQCAINDKDRDSVVNALKHFPEFKKIYGDYPVLDAMRLSRKGLLDVPYSWQDPSSEKFIDALRDVRKLYKDKEPAVQLYDRLFPLYEEFIIKSQYWKLDYSPDYYRGLVYPIISSKDFDRMVHEEHDKGNKSAEAFTLGIGVQCYTMHMAKGLEAEDVFILDADDGVIPNRKQMQKRIESNCLYDAAVDLRNERNLLYVALTRGLNSVTALYNEKPTELLTSPNENEYTFLDRVYENTVIEDSDLEAFLELYNRKG